MTTTTGRLSTPHASRYLQQLCKHFGHKVETSFDERQGRIAFAAAVARLDATADTLAVTIEAGDEETLARMRGVIDSHLERFAFREGVKGLEWDGVASGTT